MTIKEIEVNILNEMFKRLNEAGYFLIGYYDSEEYFTSNKNEDAINWLYEVDDIVKFELRKGEEKKVYWILPIVGNGGYDIISDYGCTAEEFEKIMESMDDYCSDLESGKIRIRTERETELFKLLYKLRIEAMHYLNTGNGKMFLEKAINDIEHIITRGEYDDIIYKGIDGK